MSDNTPERPAEAHDPADDWTYPGGIAFPYYHTVRFVIWVVSLFYFRLTIRGWRNIPATGPVLLVSNHSSHLDPPLISATCRRRLAFLAKSELFKGKIFGFLIGGLGAFPIRRGGGDRAALRTSLDLLRKDIPLLMFPEGNRTTTGEIGEAKTGVAMLISQVPEATIVPIRIDGSFKAWPPGRKFPAPARISITVGKAFKLSDLKDLPTIKKQLYHEIGREIMNRIMRAEP
ncbi:1-acyl-sn-glycerol-3-phosphate acyltransferase [bacterium]|nr:1-acyl-sn-glycerol-3-phosphate acyltransferase [bacterium]